MNVVAIFHAYQFTHFSQGRIIKTNSPKKLNIGQKISTLIFGVSNPRPKNEHIPPNTFQAITLQSNKEIACWNIEVKKSKGTVILFHGFSGEKSSLLGQSAVFNELGYSTFLVDFMGSGGSEGKQTTIGFFEAEQVTTAFEYIQKKGVKTTYLYGSSMGAVAIMKAMKDDFIKPHGLILECPFGTMLQTVSARFKNMGVPAFPMANLLVFWGGIQNGFWAFGHNPTEYARQIASPVLLLHGAKDDKVSQSEIHEIFQGLKGEKELVIYDKAGHESYLNSHRLQWVSDVKSFLHRHTP